MSAFAQVVGAEFFRRFNETHGCILPCHGGVYMQGGYTLCTQEAQYDGQALGLLYMAIMDTMKKSCKISDIQYGPLHVKEGQNKTRSFLKV